MTCSVAACSVPPKGAPPRLGEVMTCSSQAPLRRTCVGMRLAIGSMRALGWTSFHGFRTGSLHASPAVKARKVAGLLRPPHSEDSSSLARYKMAGQSLDRRAASACLGITLATAKASASLLRVLLINLIPRALLGPPHHHDALQIHPAPRYPALPSAWHLPYPASEPRRARGDGQSERAKEAGDLPGHRNAWHRRSRQVHGRLHAHSSRHLTSRYLGLHPEATMLVQEVMYSPPSNRSPATSDASRFNNLLASSCLLAKQASDQHAPVVCGMFGRITWGVMASKCERGWRRLRHCLTPSMKSKSSS